MPKRILISGASIAGPALAFWLTRDGHDVTIIERAPTLRPGGYAVDFRGTAMPLLDRMGLLDAVRRHETRVGKINMVDAQDRIIARMPDGFTSGDIEILRGDLARVLVDATQDSTHYIFGDSIASLTETPTAVDVTFTSGRAEPFDLVVGADGLHSNVRALTFGDESNFVHHLGYYFGVFTLPDILNLNDEARYYGELGKRVSYYGTKNGTAKASLYFASPPFSYNRHDLAAQKALLREKFADVKWKTAQILEHLDAAPDFYFDSLSQVRMSPWSKGRVVLLGDAAACPSPQSGMGTSIAIVGAYTLAGELKLAGDDHTTAFTRYESTLRPFVTEAQKLAEGVSWFVPTTRLKLWFSRRLWSWMPKKTLHELMIDNPTRIASMVPLRDYNSEAGTSMESREVSQSST